MLETIMSEQALLKGFGVIIASLIIMVAIDVWRRKTGNKRRTTSPYRQWIATMILLWSIAAIAVWAWVASGRTITDLGFHWGQGAAWKIGLAWVLAIAFLSQQLVQIFVIRRDEEAREEVRRVVFDSGDYDQIMPRRRQDVWLFQLLAVTAGITEEIVFRAFLISFFALVMPIWFAAAAALALFIAGHAYQGVKGLIRILPVSIVLTLCYVLSGSLWPGIILHVAVDVFAGILVWIVLPRDGYVKARTVEQAA